MIIFSLLSLLLTAHAADVPYDTACVEMGKKWEWIKSYDPDSGHKRVYANWSVIKKDIANSKTQKKVISQLVLWEEIDRKAPCLKTYAGVRFEKGALIIDDMDKFRTFRLAKNHLVCLKTNIEFDTREKKLMLNERYRRVDNTRTKHTSLQHNNAYNQIIAEDKSARDKLYKNIQDNNLMGDVGFENYCMDQLKTGILIDQARTSATDLKICDTARKNGNLKILSSSVCGGYPSKMKTEIDNIKYSLDNVKKNGSGQQPLIKVTLADNNVYSSYKNDYKALIEAQKLATLSLKNIYASDKYMQANNINRSVESVGFCSNRDGEDAVSDQYLRGVKCGDYKSLTILVTDFNSNIDIVKTLHRENLIEELNVHSFQEAIKSKYYLLDDNNPADYSLKTAMDNGKNNPKVALKTCQTIAGPELCKGPYLAAYNKGTKDAANFSAKTRHFLSYDSKWLKQYYNDRIRNLLSFCEMYKNSQNNQLIQFSPGWESSVQTLMMQLRTGPTGPYLNLQSISAIARLQDFKSGADYCNTYNPKHAYYLNEEQIESARAEFKVAIEKQLERTSDFSAPDRGSPSNIWGKKACQAPSMKMKNDMYALNSLYKSHAYLTGRIMTSMNKTEQKIYSEVLCEAKECDYQVDSINEDVSSAVKVLAISTNFIPYVGPLVYTGITAAVEIHDVVRKKQNSDTDYDNLIGGVISDGVDTEFTGTMGELLKKLSTDKNPSHLTEEIARTIVINLAQLGVTQGVVKPLALKLSRDIVLRIVKARGVGMTNFEKEALKVIVAGGLVAIQEATKKGLNVGTKQSIVDILKNTGDLVVTVSTKDK